VPSQSVLRSVAHVTPDILASPPNAGRAASPGRLAWLDVDLRAVVGNLRAVQQWVGPSTGVMAVVKANAYGHGLVPVARAAVEGGAAALGVALLEEGLELRQSGVAAPVVVLGAGLPEQAEALVAAGISQTVSTPEMAKALARAAERLGTRARVHVKIDTGMGRVGTAPEDAAELVTCVLEQPSLELEGIATHIGWDTPEHDGRTIAQAESFHRLLGQLARDCQARPRWRHAANSLVTLQCRPGHLDLVRAGLLTYGIVPSSIPTSDPRLDRDPLDRLLPALSLRARVTQVRGLPAGHPVSYGGTAVLDRPSRLAVVPIGYADGYPRSATNRGHVLIHNRCCPLVGAVCMDQIVVDVTDVPQAAPGDEVVLIGRQGAEEIGLRDLADRSDAILHEVVSGLSPRLPRVWHGCHTS